MLGCKRYIDRFSAKTGEVNSSNQMMKNMDPLSNGDSNYDADGMRPRIAKELFRWDGTDIGFDSVQDQWDAAYKYHKNIEAKNARITQAVTEDNIFVSKGKIQVEGPKKKAQEILNKLSSSIGYGKFEESALKDYLYEKEGDSVNLKDFSDTPLGLDNRKRLAEILTRMNRVNTFEKDLKSKDKVKRNTAKKSGVPNDVFYWG